ncbi:hypothetical protein [Prevotella aurantiaca]|jgi:hypothetical protein|uniref:Uncharacterized protein n=1 Tax=Prevotella aurantiaca TaxID=596085 RepID=A0A930HLQ9_9BACT|nr:hypothetical protein [Prevotella aurantiaca]MBF1383962.1 hypothetical protein [Prevotella aurantiaca]
MKKKEELSIDLKEQILNEGMSQIFGGGGPTTHINNGSGECTNINRGSHCSVINHAHNCSVINNHKECKETNNWFGNCSDINRTTISME